ncbi:MAG: hypothetical protein KDJ47_04770 [Hyphomicrobiaceae bacterium]|nr:hypothetical protein [Hyphomicrobiaceae bacterium]
MTAALIPLAEWGSRHFDPPKSIHTLRRWVRDNRILPAPVKAGREYRVHPNAQYVGNQTDEVVRGIIGE